MIKRIRKAPVAAGLLVAVALAALTVSALPVSALAALPAEKTPTVAGVVSAYSASEHSFSVRDDQGKLWKFLWNHETKFNGVVSNGARVSVRYTPQPDGANVAQTVGVLK